MAAAARPGPAHRRCVGPRLRVRAGLRQRDARAFPLSRLRRAVQRPDHRCRAPARRHRPRLRPLRLAAVRMSLPTEAIERVAAALRTGGVVAYPTEAVFGLGCDPHDRAAFDALFALKRRPPTQGVLLIGATFEQVAPYIDLAATPADALARVQASWPGPHTWILPRAPGVPDWIAGA